MEQFREREEIERERRYLPDEQGRDVGQMRQRRHDKQKDGRIVPSEERRGVAEYRLFLRVLEHRIEGRRWPAFARIGACRVEGRKIRAERAAVVVAVSMRGGGEEDERRCETDQQCRGPEKDALARHERAASQEIEKCGQAGCFREFAPVILRRAPLSRG